MPDPSAHLAGVRAVSFDVGGTLIEPHPSVGAVYSESAARCRGERVDPETLDRRFHRAWRSRREFDFTREAWRRLVAAIFDGLLARPLDEELFEALYERFGEAAAWRCHEDAVGVLETLASADYALGITSNWDERLRPLLEGMGLSRHFRAITISAEAGWVKPDARLFRETARRLGVDPERMLHVGDGEEEDWMGAIRAGCQGAWLRRGAADAEWPRIASLTDLVPALVKTKQCASSIRNNFDSDPGGR